MCLVQMRKLENEGLEMARRPLSGCPGQTAQGCGGEYGFFMNKTWIIRKSQVSKQMVAGEILQVESAGKSSWRWILSWSLKLVKDLPQLGILFLSQGISFCDEMPPVSSLPSKGTMYPYPLKLCVFEKYFLGPKRYFFSLQKISQC